MISAQQGVVGTHEDAEHEGLRSELATEQERARRLEAELAYASQRLRALVGTHRWRAATAAAKPLDRARAHLGRQPGP